MTEINKIPISSASIDITNKCNLRCRHCFNNSGEHNLPCSELNDFEFKDAIEQIIKISPTTACICGGEPLLRKEMTLESIRCMKANGIKHVNMVTNGYLIDCNTAKEIYNSGVDIVQISVDGFENSHNWLRNKDDAFEKAISAISCLNNVGCSVGVACTPTKNNISEIEDLINFLSTYEIKTFRMQPIMALGRANSMADMFPSQQEYLRLSRLLKKISLKSTNNIKIEWGDPTEHLYTMKSGFPLNIITINAYGDLLMSPYIPISFGNIKKHTLEEYIQNGLCRLYEYDTVKKILDMMCDENNMDLSNRTRLPKLYESELCQIDIIDDDLSQKLSLIL